MVSHVFEPVGNDGGLLQFWTPSWSRPDHEGHEISLVLPDLSLSCSCEDSVMRTKNRRKPGDGHACKHCRKFSELVWPVIAQAVGAPL